MVAQVLEQAKHLMRVTQFWQLLANASETSFSWTGTRTTALLVIWLENQIPAEWS
jgi:hypothetical protein